MFSDTKKLKEKMNQLEHDIIALQRQIWAAQDKHVDLLVSRCADAVASNMKHKVCSLTEGELKSSARARVEATLFPFRDASVKWGSCVDTTPKTFYDPNDALKLAMQDSFIQHVVDVVQQRYKT